ncbi:hypothetical protein JW960_09955 [candidate division KSB1 bacterium]|nr:hypothetical protein [candidate division KSB1 bacterium]
MRNLFFKLVLISSICTASSYIFASDRNAGNAHLEKKNLKKEENIKKANGKLTKKSSIYRYLYNENFKIDSNNPREIALSYLQTNHKKLGTDNKLSTVKINKIKKSKGGTHIKYLQHIKGIPVYASNSTITLNKSNVVKFVSNNYRYNLSINTTDPQITKNEAIIIAKKYLNVKGKILGEETPNDIFPELTDKNGFNFTRSEQEFEAVMVYYHIDKSTRRLIELGYDEPSQHQFKADPHGLNGADNSHYMPSQNYVAFGDGCVDDAEDADVIWHEHAHSFQENFDSSMVYLDETASLMEGCSDYWAASYSRYTNDFRWGDVFNWVGHNPCWEGRECDLDWHYSQLPINGSFWVHNDGQIWASALMKIWEDIGRDITDELFLESHYIWGTSPGFQDAAAAFITADQNIYNGAHLCTIISHFGFHGLYSGQTTEGTVCADEFWTDGHTLTDNVTVPDGIVLTISDGATIDLNGFNINCEGSGHIIRQGDNTSFLPDISLRTSGGPPSAANFPPSSRQ